MKRFVSLAAVLVLFACGGGGGGGGSGVTPPAQSITGTYELIAVDLRLADGTRITERDLPGLSGRLWVGPLTYTQQISLAGQSFAVSGAYRIFYTRGTVAGYLRIATSAGLSEIPFEIDGMDVETYSGIQYNPYFGQTFEEWDRWRKVSNATRDERANEASEESHRPLFPGELLK